MTQTTTFGPTPELSTTQNHPHAVEAPSAIIPVKRAQKEAIAVSVPGLAQPMDILAAVASASREPMDCEAEMDFDDGGEGFDSSDSSCASASASGLSDTDDDDFRSSTQRTSASKRRAPSSASSSGAKRLKMSSSPGRREVALLMKETHPPPKAKAISSPKSNASPRAAPKQALSSSAVTSGVKYAAKTAAGISKTKLAVLMSARCDQTDEIVDVLVWASKQVKNRKFLAQFFEQPFYLLIFTFSLCVICAFYKMERCSFTS